MARQKRREEKREQKLNWSKFTNFRSRRTKHDLAELCAGQSQAELAQVFSTRDKTGLCPIHWAAINNRSDLIEFMADHGTPLWIKCKNRLFANGSTLHLAAMHGSIEAAAMLLQKFNNAHDQTEIKTLNLPPKSSDVTASKEAISEPEAEKKEEGKTKIKNRARTSEFDWLKERDLEGQTALMRAAAPRSKRLDAIRDLLRKNLWSLNGRPAEMAMYLIIQGADWRAIETRHGMNLMHLAIVNDHEDIVGLLLALDGEHLISVRARLKSTPSPASPSAESRHILDFETIDLDSTDESRPSSPASAADSSDSDAQTRPLIDSKAEQAKKLLATGVQPLELAIVYGRMNIISLLWHAKANYESALNQASMKLEIAPRRGELRRILIRSCWLTNKVEMVRLVRASSLRFLLALDLGILSLFWMPAYLSSSGIDSAMFNLGSGIFIFSYCVTLALAFRVMLRNPGYLRRSSVQYVNEIKLLLNKNGRQPTSENPNKSNELSEQVEKQKQRDAAPPGGNGAKHTEERKRERDKQPKQLSLEERVRMLCHKCRCIRRPRSRHCNYCNHCVQDFDHHCIYLGCCIGRKNRLDFLLMLLMLSLTAIYGTILCSSSPNSGGVWHFLGLVWIAKYILIGGLTALCILRRASLGVTLYESIRSKRIRKIFGHRGPPEDISKSHRIYATHKGSFWRYSPDPFITGDTPIKKILHNLEEFANFNSFEDYLLSVGCADTPLGGSAPVVVPASSNSERTSDLYKLV